MSVTTRWARHTASGELFAVRIADDDGSIVSVAGPMHYSETTDDVSDIPLSHFEIDDATWAAAQPWTIYQD